MNRSMPLDLAINAGPLKCLRIPTDSFGAGHQEAATWIALAGAEGRLGLEELEAKARVKVGK